MKKISASCRAGALLCTVLLLVSCGASKSRLPVQEWQGVTIGVETRPAPVVVGMNEFLVSARGARGAVYDLLMSARGARGAVYDLLIFIRVGDNDPWIQSIQDGHTGVYRRALRVGAGQYTLQVRVRRAGQETVLNFALPEPVSR